MSTLRLTNLQHTDASDPNIVLANDRTAALADGTASAPALSFQDDLDTGLYSPGANSIALGVGGSAILTIASDGTTTLTGAAEFGGTGKFNGHVAIGQAVVNDNQLRVTSDSVYNIVAYSNRSSGAETDHNFTGINDSGITSSITKGGTATFGVTSGSYIQLAQNTGVVINDGKLDVYTATQTTSAETFIIQSDVGTTKEKKVVILADGRTGIGTSSPEEILHIAAASEAVGNRDGVMFQSTSALAADTGLPLVFTSHIGTQANYGVASIAGRKENATSGQAGGYLQFATGNSAGAISEKVRIDSDGNVGINKFSSLGAKLHIQDYSATDTTPIKLRNYKASVNTKAALMFELSTSSGQGGTAVIKGVCGTDAGGTDSQNDGGLEFQTSSGGAGTLATALLINKDRTLQLPSDSPGIGFGSSTSADLLDDYEEGTFIPVVHAGADDGSSGAPPYAIQGGRFTKIGNKVYTDIYIRFANGAYSTGAHAQIGGLPFYYF